MRTIEIKLGNNHQEIQSFVEDLSGLKGSFDFIDGDYILDARSLMGIFGLDLTKALKLRIEVDTPENLNVLKRYMVEK